MARPLSDARDRVLSVAVRHLTRAGVPSITLDQIADEADCAKGLVTYHFGTKDQLVVAAAEEILRVHATEWQRALLAETVEAAVRQTWQTLVAEVREGFWRAWLSLAASRDRVIVHMVNNHTLKFVDLLRVAFESQIRTMGLEPTISVAELAQFLAVGLQGLGLQLAAGVKPEVLEGAHSALWIAVLGMTRPTSGRTR